jgi:C4-dicarboxylate-specific signal transduction histidine kinase
LIVVEDITAQKLAEEKIKHQEAQMITTAKMSALGEMAAGIAHEINNPLAIISASAERLHFLVELEKLSPEKACELSRKITGTVGRIAKIISGLRSFARQGAKDQFNAVHVQTIVDDTLSFCQERLRHASIQLNVRIEPPDLAIMCRPAEISQVLLNLLNNAHDALHDQPVREIEIGAAIISDATEIWVKDSGSGIPPEVRSKIMQPFFTTKDIGKGTGLGLSISSGIAAAHGGSLRLDESSPQTRFVVRLPAGPAASAEPSQERLSKAS